MLHPGRFILVESVYFLSENAINGKMTQYGFQSLFDHSKILAASFLWLNLVECEMLFMVLCNSIRTFSQCTEALTHLQ